MSDAKPSDARRTGQAPPRQSKPGEELWTFKRSDERRRAVLRDHDQAGFELQFFVNDEFVYARHYDVRAFALAEADAVRDAYRASGWTCSRCAGVSWICEEHPDKPDRHDSCSGSGIPCPACNTGNARRRLPAGSH